MKAKILIADADRNLSEVLKVMLRRMEHRVKICDALPDALILLAEEHWNLLLCDVKFWNSEDSANIIAQAVAKNIPVAIMATYGALSQAESARAIGAFAVLTKPCRAEELNVVVSDALKKSAELVPGDEQDEIVSHFGCFIGEHQSMRKLYTQIEKIAATDMTVLIRGESGTGKELVARAIHSRSARADRPFLAVNCASLSDQLLESELFGHVKGAFTGAIKNKEGLFEAAAGGTLFLDEIGSVSVGMQQALLRVLEDHKVRPVGGTEYIQVNTRVIAATNERLEECIDDGRFRLDLFHRLSVLPVQLPPLRERREDISLIVRAVLLKNGCHAKLAIDALRALENAPWPGNVRQLENTMLRIIALLPENSDVISLSDIPKEVLAGAQPVPQNAAINLPRTDEVISLKAYLKQCERQYIRQVLERHNGDKETAAKALGISVATFYRKYEED